jgi:hypothetical protein
MSEDTVRKFNFDPTINLGHVLTAGAFLFSTMAAWVSLDARVVQAAKEIARVEDQAARATVRVENVLMEKITTVQAGMNQTQVRTADDIREVKTMIRDGFKDLDAKLDKKADRPGR